MARSKRIIMLHGRGRKPGADALQHLWLQALEAGLQRDQPELLETFRSVRCEMIYFADAVQEFDRTSYDIELDLANRRQALERLQQLDKPRQFRRRNYEGLPGKSAVKEFVMDFSAVAGLGAAAVGRALPELKFYWRDQPFSRGVQQQLQHELHNGLGEGQDILLLSHCMGSVIAYDVLWQLGHQQGVEGRVSCWVTLGSPLGSRYVQSKLAGSGEAGPRRYPVNVIDWHNLAAEDDYVCHDKTVADDFAGMLQQRLIGGISDYTVYNLAVRYGRSNPHSSLGYLIHPRMTRCLAEWLQA